MLDKSMAEVELDLRSFKGILICGYTKLKMKTFLMLQFTIFSFSAFGLDIQPSRQSARQPTVEYVCWEASRWPGMAYETSATLCDDGSSVTQAGTPDEDPTPAKKIVCLMNAACVALTPKVSSILQKKLGIKNAADAKKFTAEQLATAFLGSEYMGQASMLQCEGKGKISKGIGGMLNLTEVQCPKVTECANTQQVFYNFAISVPGALPNSGSSQPEIKTLTPVRK